ncbi:MAG: chemotaxis protein CheX [Deltaproteobacteria bacterium]|nr:chemotaxis protein CheX [Deltaproteobacteria bacterium]
MLENLKAATFEIFETMFFLFPESSDGHDCLFDGCVLQAWSPVAGSKSFRVGLTVPLPLARKMAANFLGLGEEEVESATLTDILREAATMVAGNFLSREGASAAFRLAPPQSVQFDGETRKWQQHAHYLLFSLDNHNLEVFLERT